MTWSQAAYEASSNAGKAILQAGLLVPVAAAFMGWIGPAAAIAAAIALLLLGIAFDYALIMRRGAKPLPAAPDATRRVETLILALADAIKATSNDQNVQRMSRDLRAGASALAAEVHSREPA